MRMKRLSSKSKASPMLNEDDNSAVKQARR
jgi:hypothetical protein